MGLVAKKDEDQACKHLKVIVEGKETFIDQQDISKLIADNFGNIIGVPLKDIETDKIERSLQELPYVSNASVFADMDGVLQINVQQREVILRVINQQGKEYYVDTQNKKIPVTLKYVPHVLVANGNIRESYDKSLDTVQSKLVNDLVAIVNHIKGSQLWENQIVQLYGDAKSLDHKLDRLEVYYKHILPRVGTEAYEKVNVKYDGQIVCERRKGWFIDSLQMKINN
jgi:cell division protein FtsQ